MKGIKLTPLRGKTTLKKPSLIRIKSSEAHCLMLQNSTLKSHRPYQETNMGFHLS